MQESITPGIWIEKLKINMYFKKIYANCQNGFRIGFHANGLIGADLVNTPLSSSLHFMKSHQISLQ